MGKGLILVVDDDRDILFVCNELLLNSDFEVIPCSGAPEALEVLTQSDKVDVIITDFRMPDMNGLEFLESLKERGSTIPTIMFTGLADKALAIAALNLGCHFLLEKPLHNKELIHYTEQALAYRKLNLITEKLLVEGKRMIGFLKDLSINYEDRIAIAESLMKQDGGGAPLDRQDSIGYLKTIAQGFSIEAEVADLDETMEKLDEEHRQWKLVANG